MNFICFDDHRPLLVSFSEEIGSVKCDKMRRAFRFHFEEVWSKDFKCKSIMDSSWQHVAGFDDKLRECGMAVIVWDRSKFKEMQHEMKVLKKKIKMVDCGHNRDGLKAVKRFEKQLNEILHKEEQYWKQKNLGGLVKRWG